MELFFMDSDDKLILIHEILHSFGEKDIYPLGQGAPYQLLNCFLYGRAHTTHSGTPNLFTLNGEHLCPYEAKTIGWT